MKIVITTSRDCESADRVDQLDMGGNNLLLEPPRCLKKLVVGSLI